MVTTTSTTINGWCYTQIAAYALLLLAIGPSLGQLQAPTEAEAKQLQDCLNSNHTFQAANWRQLLFEQKTSSIKVERLWWSRRPPAVDVTIVTQLSMSRLGSFAKLCESYGGPVSGVVYAPIIQSSGSRLSLRNAAFVRQSLLAVDEYFQRLEATGSCQLQIMFAYEVFETYESSLLYPVNTLRNYALLQAKTALVFADDADLLVSSTMLAVLRSNSSQVQGLFRNCLLGRHLYTVPAFEVQEGVPEKWRMDVAEDALTCKKLRLERLKDTKMVDQFHISVPMAHSPTRYDLLFASDAPYRIQYQWGYEPWLIGARTVIPLWDVRFRGYGANKALHSLHSAQMNFTFAVWPHAWVVHIPHNAASGRNMFVKKWTFQTDPKTSLYHIITALAKSVVEAGYSYRPVVDDVTTLCMRQMPWWYPNNAPLPETQQFVSQTAYATEVKKRQAKGVAPINSLLPELSHDPKPRIIRTGDPVGKAP